METTYHHVRVSSHILSRSFLFSCAFFLLLLCMFIAFPQATYGKSAQHSSAIPPAIVEVVAIKASFVYDKITATGSVTAIPGIVVKPEIAGRIVHVYFKSGDKVKVNAPLLEIYPAILKAQLTQAQADLKLAELNYARYAKLYETHTISKADYDKAKATLDTNKGKVEQSQAALDQTLIRAPFAGRLGVSKISLGQYVNVGQDVVSLQNVDPIYIDFTVPELFAGKVAVGQSIELHASAYPQDIFKGTIQAIDPLIVQKTRSINIRAVIPNKDEKLRPGGFADVVLFVSGPQSVIKVSQTAVVYSTAGNYVYKVVNGHAAKTLVTLGERDAQSVVIKSGLKEGDVIVTAGQQKITADGVPVIVMPPIGAGSMVGDKGDKKAQK